MLQPAGMIGLTTLQPHTSASLLPTYGCSDPISWQHKFVMAQQITMLYGCIALAPNRGGHCDRSSSGQLTIDSIVINSQTSSDTTKLAKWKVCHSPNNDIRSCNCITQSQWRNLHDLAPSNRLLLMQHDA